MGLFREDLYHRLNVIKINLPPLRDRLDDIPELLDFFLEKSALELKIEKKVFSEDAIKRLKNTTGQVTLDSYKTFVILQA